MANIVKSSRITIDKKKYVLSSDLFISTESVEKAAPDLEVKSVNPEEAKLNLENSERLRLEASLS